MIVSKWPWRQSSSSTKIYFTSKRIWEYQSCAKATKLLQIFIINSSCVWTWIYNLTLSAYNSSTMMPDVLCKLFHTKIDVSIYIYIYIFEKIAIMTWLSVTKHLCHRWPHIYSILRNSQSRPSFLFNDVSPDL
jgi:hypothetical protein